jgi:hypothetical protein
MKPQPFVMENPVNIASGSGNWQFWLTLPQDKRSLYDVVASWDCVSHLHYEDVWRRASVIIDPRYDYEEAWLWIYEQLQIETAVVELSEFWDMDSTD